jgi:triacylglycerol lipase
MKSYLNGGVGLLGLVVLSAGCAASDDSGVESAAPQDLTTAAPALFTAPTDKLTAKNPFVFVHAFNGSATNSWSFNGVKEALEADGDFVVLAEVAPFDGTPARAAELVPQLDEARAAFCRARGAADQDACVAATKVNLVGHSQGGLDIRWAVSRLGYAPHTASVTTISSPHGGTPLGDTGLRLLDAPGLDPIAEAFFSLVAEGRSTAELAQDTHFRDAMFWLSEARAKDPANDMPDAPDVLYQSWAGIATIAGIHGGSDRTNDEAVCGAGKDLGLLQGDGTRRTGRFSLIESPFFVPAIPLFGASERPNDGHIPVASAKHGEFLGCIPADHLALVGRPALEHEGAQPWTGFDHLAFYRTIAHDLAKRGL